MADLKINATTQITPTPLTIGTSATTAMAGDKKVPRICQVRVAASSANVQVYSVEGIPTGTWMAIDCSYIGAGSGQGPLTFTRNTTYLSSWAGSGGADLSRWQCFLSGYCQINTAIPAGVWTTIGTINLNANSNQCYGGIGVEY